MNAQCKCTDSCIFFEKIFEKWQDSEGEHPGAYPSVWSIQRPMTTTHLTFSMKIEVYVTIPDMNFTRIGSRTQRR
jgi:hypothetical protein